MADEGYSISDLRILQGLEPRKRGPDRNIGIDTSGTEALMAFGLSTDEMYPHEVMARLREADEAGWPDAESTLRDIDLALGGGSYPSIPAVDRILIAQVAIEHAVAKAARGEGWMLPVTVADADWLGIALDRLLDRLPPRPGTP